MREKEINFLNNFHGRMIYNDTKKTMLDFLRDYLKDKPAKKLGVAAFLNIADFVNLPGNPKIVPIREIYTDKLFWLLEGDE